MVRVRVRVGSGLGFWSGLGSGVQVKIGPNIKGRVGVRVKATLRCIASKDPTAYQR